MERCEDTMEERLARDEKGEAISEFDLSTAEPAPRAYELASAAPGTPCFTIGIGRILVTFHPFPLPSPAHGLCLLVDFILTMTARRRAPSGFTSLLRSQFTESSTTRAFSAGDKLPGMGSPARFARP